MLTMERPRRGFRGPALATVLTTALVMVAGQAVTAAERSIEPTAPTVEVSPDDVQATVVELRDQLAALSDLNATLSDANAILTDANARLDRDIADLRVRNDRLNDSITLFDAIYDPLEADRQLLFELRKGLPETRAEAEAQLARIQRLALSSNPTRLGQIVDRVSEAAPTFFEWRFTQFPSQQEAAAAYVSTGANAFDTSMEEFRDAVLLSVANRIDGLLNTIDRVR